MGLWNSHSGGRACFMAVAKGGIPCSMTWLRSQAVSSWHAAHHWAQAPANLHWWLGRRGVGVAEWDKEGEWRGDSGREGHRSRLESGFRVSSAAIILFSFQASILKPTWLPTWTCISKIGIQDPKLSHGMQLVPHWCNCIDVVGRREGWTVRLQLFTYVPESKTHWAQCNLFLNRCASCAVIVLMR